MPVWAQFTLNLIVAFGIMFIADLAFGRAVNGDLLSRWIFSVKERNLAGTFVSCSRVSGRLARPNFEESAYFLVFCPSLRITYSRWTIDFSTVITELRFSLARSHLHILFSLLTNGGSHEESTKNKFRKTN